MANVKTLSANNVNYAIKDEVARTAIEAMSNKVLNHYGTGESVNLEDTLATISENEFYQFLFTGATTGELVQETGNTVQQWSIVNIPADTTGSNAGGVQLAFGMGTSTVWYRRKIWWSSGSTPITWSKWVPIQFDMYSTNETFTGKYWIDGKRIYRKVYKGGVSASQGVIISASNVDSLINYEGWYRVAGNTHYKPWYDTTGGATWFVATIDSNLLRVRFDTSGTPIADINDVCCIVEYTKTTD